MIDFKVIFHDQIDIFLEKKPVSTHTEHIHLYVACFIFSRKRRAHADLIPEGFLHCQPLGSVCGVQR